MANIFRTIPVKKPGRNLFNLSHQVKTSCNAGQLIPFMCEDVLPNDVWSNNSEVFVRFAPLASPVMHQVDCFTYYFFVPNRLIWDDWEDFITGGEYNPSTGLSGDDIVPPYIDYSVFSQDSDAKYLSTGSLADYFGMPVVDTAGKDLNYTYFGKASALPKVSALPFRAYAQIWNDYFRDENMTNSEIDFNHEISGQLSAAEARKLMSIKHKAWSKDYFTSALPWAQRGAPVTLPIGGTAPVSGYLTNRPQVSAMNNVVPVYSTTDYGSSKLAVGNLEINGQISLDGTSAEFPVAGSADMSQVSSLTINELRRQIALQKWYEANARGGSRYIEQIYSHFGCRSSDARLQRAEYLGGGRTPVVISDVEQTSSTDAQSPQGNLAGKAMSYGNQNGFKRHFEEHGWIIGILCVMPKAEYMQGLPRKFSRMTRFDYAWPEFGHLGEQEILKQELYYNFMDSSDLKYNNSVFGYTPRFAEYKDRNDYATGEFRKGSLATWHWPRVFDENNLPVLSQQFITANPSTDIFAVDDDGATQKLWISIYNHTKASRCLPKYGVPML